MRLGEPDARYTIDRSFRRIQAPDGFDMLYLNSEVQIDLEVWVYGEEGSDRIIIFGSKYGFGELTLLEDILKGIEYDNKYMVDRFGQKIKSATDRSTRSLVLYGILETLQGYHPRFSELYTNFRFRLMKAKRETSYGYSELLSQLELTFNSKQRFAISNEVVRLEDEKSSLEKWIGHIPIRTEVYRFFDINEDPEYALVVQPELEKQNYGSEKYPLLYSSNLMVGSIKADSNVQIADSSVVELEEKFPNRLYTLKANKGQVDIKFAAEVFALSNNSSRNLPVYFPSNLLASSGKVHLELQDPIKQSDDMLISDIFVGKQQKINHEERFPFIPRIDNNFLPKEDLLLYFEAYNIPKGGYKIEYSVSNINFLGIKRAIKERQGIALLEKEVVGVQQKYLFVNLSGLEEGKFEVDLKFTPIEASAQPIERTIHFRITN